jgi:hypothetical protein
MGVWGCFGGLLYFSILFHIPSLNANLIIILISNIEYLLMKSHNNIRSMGSTEHKINFLDQIEQ